MSGVPVPPEQRVWTDADLRWSDWHVDFLRAQKRLLHDFLQSHYSGDYDTSMRRTDTGADCIHVGVPPAQQEFVRELLLRKPPSITVELRVKHISVIDDLGSETPVQAPVGLRCVCS